MVRSSILTFQYLVESLPRIVKLIIVRWTKVVTKSGIVCSESTYEYYCWVSTIFWLYSEYTQCRLWSVNIYIHVVILYDWDSPGIVLRYSIATVAEFWTLVVEMITFEHHGTSIYQPSSFFTAFGCDTLKQFLHLHVNSDSECYLPFSYIHGSPLMNILSLIATQTEMNNWGQRSHWLAACIDKISCWSVTFSSG